MICGVFSRFLTFFRRIARRFPIACRKRKYGLKSVIDGTQQCRFAHCNDSGKETLIRGVKHLLAFGKIMLCALALGFAACAELKGAKQMSSPRLYRVTLPVADIEKAAEFYGALFETAGERVSPGRHYFNLGGTILALYDPDADGDGPSRGWVHHENQYVYIAVSDLEATLMRTREAGAEILGGIKTMRWGERLFYARDPFGAPMSFVDETTLFTGGASQPSP